MLQNTDIPRFTKIAGDKQEENIVDAGQNKTGIQQDEQGQVEEQGVVHEDNTYDQDHAIAAVEAAQTEDQAGT